MVVVGALAGVRTGAAGQGQEGGLPRQPAAILARNRGIARAIAWLDRDSVPAAIRRLGVLTCHAVPRLEGAMLANPPAKGMGGGRTAVQVPSSSRARAASSGR